MELLVTLSNINLLNKYTKGNVDGLLFGGPLSLRFNYSLKEIEMINEYCLKESLKRYVTIDAFISEYDRVLVNDYLEFLKKLDVDGIYFTDLGIINVAGGVDLTNKLIYDPDTLLTNSLDVNFFLRQGIGTVLARELSFDEVKDILEKNPAKCDMQVFGHLKMSYSKRQFMTNYFKYIGKEVDILNKRSIRLVEEHRNYKLPIIEDKYGTRIYSDYVLLMYKEYLELRPLLKRAIIDDTFIEKNELTLAALRDYKRVSDMNAEFLEENITALYNNVSFSNGYLSNKTSKVKEETNED